MHTIIVCVENSALSSVLVRVLGSERRWRVRAFDQPAAVRAYLRIIAADIVICDRLEDPQSTDFIASLRADPDLENAGFAAIGLTRDVPADLRQRAQAAEIADVLVLPISPFHLIERVSARLSHLPARPLAPGPRPGGRYGGNVVELFPISR